MKMTLWTALIIGSGLVLIAWGRASMAEDCPSGVKACKVLTITPDEIAALIQPGGIFDQAVWANRSGMTGLVDAWKRKIESAPAGTVKGEEQK